jgi:hypothetical protein
VLKAALNGELGETAFAGKELAEAMELCVGCKGCKRECANQIDMAAIKIEYQAQRNARLSVSWRDRLVASLPEQLQHRQFVRSLIRWRNRAPWLAKLGEMIFGISAGRKLPVPAAAPYINTDCSAGLNPLHAPSQALPLVRASAARIACLPRFRRRAESAPEVEGAAKLTSKPAASLIAEPTPPLIAEPAPPLIRGGREGFSAPETNDKNVILFVDTFAMHFEPEIAHAAHQVLSAAGYNVTTLQPPADDEEPGRALCCGRTYLSLGQVEAARREAQRMHRALRPALAAGTPIVGLEPSCILSLRDDHLKLGLGEEAIALSKQVYLFEEFIAREHDRKRFTLEFKPLPPGKTLVHGHCHQKAVGAMKSLRKVLRLIPEFEFEFIEASCCGMAGSFGLEAEHAAISMQMAELDLLPALRAAPDATILANGFSCRHQISEGANRKAFHVALLLRDALKGTANNS